MIAILLPALGQARASARAIQCTSIIRQFGIANAIYSNDNDGYQIPVRSPNGTNPNYQAGYGFNYLTYWNISSVRESLGMTARPVDESVVGAWYKNWQLICPDAGAAIDNDNDVHSAYAMNNYSLPGPFSSWRVHHEGEISGPSRRLQMTEANYYITGYDANIVDPANGWDVWGDKLRNQDGAGLYQRYPHQRGANSLFFDGHAERQSGDEMWGDGDNVALYDVRGLEE